MFTWLVVLCCHLVWWWGDDVSKSYTGKKRPKKKKIRSPNDAWQRYLKTWDQWNSQIFQEHCSGLHKEGLERDIWTPSCKGQRPDAHPSWKTRSFIKNGGQQKCLDKPLHWERGWVGMHHCWVFKLNKNSFQTVGSRESSS